MSDYDKVRRAVEKSGAVTPRDRTGVYKALIAEAHAAARNAPRQSQRIANARPRNLGAAIRAYELDVLAGRVRDPEPEVERVAVDATADTISAPAPPAPPLSRVRTLLALTGRHLVTLARAGPAASAWMIIEPLLQIGIIVAIYLVLGHTHIMDMPPLAFAVMGTAPWFMFRMSYIRVAVAPIDAGLVLVPRIRGIDVLVSRVLAFAVIYSIAGIVMMSAVSLAGQGAAVERPLDVAASWGVVILLALGFGLTLRGLIGYVPFMQRGAPWLARILFYTSGVLFVTEQLPEFIARPLLYNPLLHAIQHMRSAYFEVYESLDVSILYALFWGLGLVTMGLILEAARRTRA